jgi:hypothetical protein
LAGTRAGSGDEDWSVRDDSVDGVDGVDRISNVKVFDAVVLLRVRSGVRVDGVRRGSLGTVIVTMVSVDGYSSSNGSW